MISVGVNTLSGMTEKCSVLFRAETRLRICFFLYSRCYCFSLLSFFQRCLEYYNRDTEVIISALLDGSVPLSVTNPELAK